MQALHSSAQALAVLEADVAVVEDVMIRRCLLLALGLALAPAASHAEDLTQVMVVGVFHMSNPGRDMHDLHVDDVLAAKRQAEIQAAVDGIGRFHPTQVDVEWPSDIVTKRYAAFSKGQLAPSRNEVVQLGFRLALANGAAVNGVDVDGEFPFGPVQDFAKAHGMDKELAAVDDGTGQMIAAQQAILDKGTISNVLRAMNTAAFLHTANAFYGAMMHFGDGAAQPGADLNTAWYRRNAYICANIVQRSKPGDRIVVFFGSGHELLLRRCLGDVPGFALVEPNDYLPK